jgi:hypothetical protein
VRLFVVVAVLRGSSPFEPPVDFVGVGAPPFAHPVLEAGEQHDRDRVGGGRGDRTASTTAPDASAVPATQAPNTSLGAVLTELFHGHNGPAASTHYLMNYTPGQDSVDVTGSGNTWAAGDTYTQAG